MQWIVWNKSFPKWPVFVKWDVTCCSVAPCCFNAVADTGDVHLLLNVARQNGKCLFFTSHAADSILACVFHSADDVCTICFSSLLTLWNGTFKVYFLFNMLYFLPKFAVQPLKPKIHWKWHGCFWPKLNVCPKCSSLHFRCRKRNLVDLYICLKFFGHIAHADPSMDHCRALRACVASLTRVWNHQLGWPHHTWLRPLNPIYHHSTFVWQLSIIETRINKPGAHSQERQCPSPDKPHDDDDIIMRWA